MSLGTTSHVFFGVSGVLLSPATDPVDAIETVLYAHHRIRSRDAIRAALDRVGNHAIDDRDGAKALFRELALEAEAERLAPLLCEPDPPRWVLAPGAVAAIELLRRERIPAGVISSIGGRLEQTLEGVGLLPNLDPVLTVKESPSPERDAEQLASMFVEHRVDPGTSFFLCAASDPALERVNRAGMQVVPIAPSPGEKGVGWPHEWRIRRVDEAVYRHLRGRD